MFVLLNLILFLTLVYFIISNKRPKKYPPGPQWFPIVGNIPIVKRLADQLGGKHKAFERLSQIYQTNILGLRLGREPVVVVSSYSLIKELLSREEFNGRPNNYFINLRCFGTRKGITMTDGEFSKNQRKFVKSHLRELGFGKEVMDQLLQTELSDMMREFEKNEQKAVDFNTIIPLSVINVLWMIVAGTRMERSDVRLSQLLTIMKKRAEFFDLSGGILNQLPWLRFIAPMMVGYTLIQKLNKSLKKLIVDSINEHKTTRKEKRNDDFIYSYLTAIDENFSENTPFTEEQLIMICVDLFIGGAVSTSTTLNFAFLMMILYPDVQNKVQLIIDDSFEKTEKINYKHRKRVPYVEAVLCEVLRFCQIAPLGGPKRALRNAELDGYIIPKDTTILYSFYSLHNNKEYWQDPEVFRPERFLDRNGTFITHEVFIPFATGLRRCIGEVLSRSFLFTFFCETVRKYNISVFPGTPQPTGKLYPGWFSSPEVYKAKMTPR